MKKITLTKGQFALVDDNDFDEMSKYNWYAYKKKNTKTFYAYRNTLLGEAVKRTVISMHRQILGLNNTKTAIDHRDMNGLNNQKSNLRIADASQNAANRLAGNSKKYKGVYIANGKQWIATICKNRERIYLGCFKTQEDAAIAYNVKAIELYGEFANLNKIAV